MAGGPRDVPAIYLSSATTEAKKFNRPNASSELNAQKVKLAAERLLTTARPVIAKRKSQGYGCTNQHWLAVQTQLIKDWEESVNEVNHARYGSGPKASRLQVQEAILSKLLEMEQTHHGDDEWWGNLVEEQKKRVRSETDELQAIKVLERCWHEVQTEMAKAWMANSGVYDGDGDDFIQQFVLGREKD